MFFPKLITDQLFTIVYKKIKAQNTLQPDIILPGQPYQSVISADITYLKVSYSAMNYTCVKVNLNWGKSLNMQFGSIPSPPTPTPFTQA